MKILLIDPSYVLDGRQLGLGILTIAAVAKDAGWDVDICDYVESSSLEEKCGFICDAINNSNVDVVGITTRCDIYPFALMIAKRIKERFGETQVVLGGPQATHTDLDTLKLCSFVDVIIRGEGEISTLNLLKALESRKPLSSVLGITYRANGEIIQNQQQPLIENVPYKLAWDILPKRQERALQAEKRYGIESGRGCPYSCSFCCTNKMWNQHYRIRSAYSLFEEMKYLNSRFGVEFFQLEHDSLMAGRHFKSFLSEFTQLNLPSFKWSCSARIDNFDTSLLKDLEAAGCERLFFGIESGSTKMQKIYNKHLDIGKSVEKLKTILEQSNIKVILSFVCGHPLETIDDVLQTLEITVQLIQYRNCINIQLHKLAPLNGSQLYQEYKDQLEFKGYVSDQAHCDQIEDFFREDIKKYPELFASFFDFQKMSMSSERVYDICYRIQPLCKAFARTITAIRILTGISLREIISILSTYDEFEDVLRVIEREYMHSAFPQIIYNICEFELALSRVRTVLLIDDFSEETRICDMVNPTLQYMEITFDPDERISANMLSKATEQHTKYKVMLWAGKQTANYKTASKIDEIVLASPVPYSQMSINRFVGEYVCEMVKNSLIKCKVKKD